MKAIRSVARRIIDRVTRGSVIRMLSETDGPAVSALLGPVDQVRRTWTRVAQIEKRIDQINQQVQHALKWVEQIDQQVQHTHKWVDQINQQVQHTHKSVDQINQQVQHAYEWIDRINQRVEHTYEWVNRINQRVDRLETASIGPGQPFAHAPALGERICGVISLLSPRDPVGHSLRRFGSDHDGGYILLEDILVPGRIAYSFGIANDVSWDLDLAERGYQVFQYDHTIKALPKEHPNFHFRNLGLCPSNLSAPNMMSLDRMIEQNGHAGKRNMILKIDIEGHEWRIVSALPSNILEQFDQIVIEYHELDRLHEDSFHGMVRQALTNIRKLFVPVHIHGNNYCDIKILGGVPVPQLLEVSYVRDGLIETAPCKRTFPTELDQPNRADRPDLFLGSFQF